MVGVRPSPRPNSGPSSLSSRTSRPRKANCLRRGLPWLRPLPTPAAGAGGLPCAWSSPNLGISTRSWLPRCSGDGGHRSGGGGGDRSGADGGHRPGGGGGGDRSGGSGGEGGARSGGGGGHGGRHRRGRPSRRRDDDGPEGPPWGRDDGGRSRPRDGRGRGGRGQGGGDATSPGTSSYPPHATPPSPGYSAYAGVPTVDAATHSSLTFHCMAVECSIMSTRALTALGWDIRFLGSQQRDELRVPGIRNSILLTKWARGAYELPLVQDPRMPRGVFSCQGTDPALRDLQSFRFLVDSGADCNLITPDLAAIQALSTTSETLGVHV
jgi:hypothetical protein